MGRHKKGRVAHVATRHQHHLLPLPACQRHGLLYLIAQRVLGGEADNVIATRQHQYQVIAAVCALQLLHHVAKLGAVGRQVVDAPLGMVLAHAPRQAVCCSAGPGAHSGAVAHHQHALRGLWGLRGIGARVAGQVGGRPHAPGGTAGQQQGACSHRCQGGPSAGGVVVRGGLSLHGAGAQSGGAPSVLADPATLRRRRAFARVGQSYAPHPDVAIA